MTKQILIAGFGGQGILFSGKLLAYKALSEGKELSWLPSYGPEMRGGTASCSVTISDESVGSPIIDNPDVLIVMNLPSLDKYSEDDDLVTIDEDEGVLDVSWFIYETIVLNIPIKHVHAPGKCNRDMMKALEAHSATRSDVEIEDSIDPRWSELLKIKEKSDLNI